MTRQTISPRTNHLVSVCMATCNGSLYIRQQIESILLQLNSGDELIISDDHSTDNTVAIIQSFNDDRIKLLENTSERLGVIKNFEKVLVHAKNDYIFLSDQDDVWLPSKVELCLNYLQDSLLVVTNCSIVNESLNIKHPSFFKDRHSGKGVLKNVWRNTFLGCCIGFRRELLHIALPIPKNVPMHDMWLGLLANINGSVAFIEQPLSLYRRHESVASPTAIKSDFSFIKRVKNRLVLCWLLCFRTLSYYLLRHFNIKHK